MAQVHPPVSRETPRADAPSWPDRTPEEARGTAPPATLAQAPVLLPLFRDLASI